jgi:branched-chain amino acid transport system ATP-binding protein
VSALLSLVDVTRRFGGVAALDTVSFDVAEGEVVGLIGPNGAGKTTLLNCISGVHRPDRGNILFEGRDICRLSPHHIARRGIGRTFQVVKPFPSMTVRENTALGALYGSGTARPRVAEAFIRADAVLEAVGLGGRGATPVTSLTIPERKRLEVARALAMRPRLLLLDEVMAGLNAVEVEAALEVVRGINAGGTTIVLIEHVMQVIVGVCDRAVVLHRGSVLAEGGPQDVLRDPRVMEAYLGRRYAEQAAAGTGPSAAGDG